MSKREEAVSLAVVEADERVKPRMSARFEHHFEQWLRELDPALRGATTTTRMFVGISLQGLALLTALAFVPGLREFFALRYGTALGLLALAVAPGFWLGRLESRGAIPLRKFGVLSLVGTYFFQLFTWGLVALTKLPGATLLAAFPILLTSFHGHLFQSSLRRPLPLIVSLAALITGAAIGADSEHAPLFAVAGPMALITQLLFGYQARLAYRARIEHTALRAAVDAQILSERAADIARISSLLNDLRGRSHDAGNALSGVLLNLPRFLQLIERASHDQTAAEEARVLGSAVVKRLNQLKELLVESREALRQRGAEALPVRAWQTLEKVARDVSQLHPHTRVSLVPAEHGDEPILLFGGALSLERVLTNVLLNACEGDGSAKAVAIQVSLRENEADGELMIEVLDDGPGFPAALLASSVDCLVSTKRSGTGLGLYTTSRVLTANGGRLLRENRAGGGARVLVALPRRHEVA